MRRYAIVARAMLVIVSMACAGSPRGAGTVVPPTDQRAQAARHIAISITESGFEPSRIQVANGDTVALVFTRKTDDTCAKDVVLHLSEANRVERTLPLNQPVELTVTFSRPGELRFGCGMDMHTGAIVVE